ncbi:hypothetical protein [Burkholderia cenocepacia]|uniref:hypothetical protein n=1 Tax=Burkholderia cenocepacia TaxID=95486 RepID=UPI0012373F63|nr:hypothetical protein [Burkholderia cenocepacia]
MDETAGALPTQPSGRQAATGFAFLLALAVLALVVPLGLSGLLSHYVSGHVPQNPLHTYSNDEPLKGVDGFLPWLVLSLGYATGLARQASIPVFVGIVGFVFLRNHAEIVQAVMVYAVASK